MKQFRFFEGIIYEDAEFTPRALYACKKLVKYDHSFYTYNIHLTSGQISSKEKNSFKIQSAVTSAKRVAEFFAEHQVPKIADHTFQRYLNTLTESYFNCWQRRNDQVCCDLKKEILAEARKHQDMALKNPAFSASRKLRLFYSSPFLFCCLQSAYRALKKFKYRLRVLLTGKN